MVSLVYAVNTCKGHHAGTLRSEKRTSSFSTIMAALTSVVSGGHEAMADAAANSTPHHRIEEPINVERLDICHLGHHRSAAKLL